MRPILIVLAILATLSPLARAATWKFDMGGASMPLKSGYKGVAKDTAYSAERGYGWSEAPTEEFDRTDAMYPRFGTKYTRAQVVEPADELLIDGVGSTKAMTFRVDLPNGRYWVLAYVGDLGRPTFKTALSANGQSISNKVDAFSYRDRGGFDNPANAGGVFRARFAVEVKDKRIELRFHQAEGRLNPYAEIGMEKSGKLGRGGEGGAADSVEGLMPFDRNAVMGIEIYPWLQAPFVMARGQLTDNTGRAGGLMKLFNGKDFKQAEQAVRAASTENNALEVSAMLLWLAGRPQVKDPYTLVADARALLEKYIETAPDDSAAMDLLTSARLFDNAMKLRNQDFDKLGIQDMRSLEGVWMADNFLRQIGPDDPLRLTSQIEIARLNAGVDPNGNGETSYRAYKVFLDLQKDYPDNKYVKMYLNGVETIDDRGAGRSVRPLNTPEEVAEARKRLRAMKVPQKYDWGYEGAPEWAVMVRDGLGWASDIVEYWVQHRQHADGSLNYKGWSDDVEILRGWAPLAAVGHSPIIEAGVKKLADGAWNSPMMNREWGIENNRADVEHITEMAGDTMPPMIYLNFGNPIYIERAMRTMRKVRDFFTGYDKNGDRLFKSVNVGIDYIDPDPHVALDSVYSHRLGLTGLMMIWYNRNPEVLRVMDEWASSWMKYAKTDLQGKPAGILPFSVGFNTGKLSFPEEAEWYKTEYVDPPAYRGSFIRLNYVYNLLLELFAVKRDEKYLAPIRAAFELVEEYADDPAAEPALGSAEWVAQSLRLWNSDFTPVLVKDKMLTGEKRFDDFIRDNAGGAIEIFGALLHFLDGPYVRYLGTGDKGYVIDGNKGLIHMLESRGFDMATQEVIMTDRAGLGFGVEQAPIGPMTGDVRGWGGVAPTYSITWKNIDRHLAALVTPEASNDRLKVLLYNFNPDAMDAGMLLWRLDVGGEYQLTMGPDADGDDKADEISYRTTFTHKHRGDAVSLKIPSRKSLVVEIGQTKPGDNNFIVPDLALASQEVVSKDGALHAIVHNIGSKDSGDFEVALYEGEGTGGRKLASQTMKNVAAPNDLVPQMANVSFEVDAKALAGPLTIAVDPEDKIYELTEVNNEATWEPGR